MAASAAASCHREHAFPPDARRWFRATPPYSDSVYRHRRRSRGLAAVPRPDPRRGVFAPPLFFLFPCPAPAADRAVGPQFLGPPRDGVYAGANLAKSWPAGGPKVVWKRDVGQGFAGPAVSDGKLVLFYRVGDRE